MTLQRIIEIPLEEIQTKKGRQKSNAGNNTCIICGKEIKKGSKHKMVHLLTNGNIVSYSGDDIEHSQGFFTVGMECARKLVIEFAF
jgi:hypothetical protein